MDYDNNHWFIIDYTIMSRRGEYKFCMIVWFELLKKILKATFEFLKILRFSINIFIVRENDS